MGGGISILEEILAWGTGLARLFANGALTAQDDIDLLALVRSAHGLPDPENGVAKTLDAAHIIAPAATGNPVQLISLAGVLNVNALAPDQVLSFDQTALTIIYGGNGSGKSGYSRALKRACRARDQSEATIGVGNLELVSMRMLRPRAVATSSSVDGQLQTVCSISNLAHEYRRSPRLVAKSSAVPRTASL